MLVKVKTYEFLDLGNDMGVSLSRVDALEVTMVYVYPDPMGQTQNAYQVRLRYRDAARAHSCSINKMNLVQANATRLLVADKIAGFLEVA